MHPITIVLPVYNVEKYIEKCLSSICSQTFKDYYIIIIDDCSVDNSVPLAVKFLENNGQEYKLISNSKNVGLSEARNIGIAAATTTYVLCLDSDDWIADTMLEKLYEVALSTNTDIVSCRGMQFFEESGEYRELQALESGVYSPDQYLINLFKGVTTAHICWRLFRRSLFTNVKFPKGVIFEDLLTLPYLLEGSNRIIQIDDPLYFYVIRREKTSITGSIPKNVKGFIEEMELLINHFKVKGVPLVYLVKFAYVQYVTFLVGLVKYSSNYNVVKKDISLILMQIKRSEINLIRKTIRPAFWAALHMVKFSRVTFYYSLKMYWNQLRFSRRNPI